MLDRKTKIAVALTFLIGGVAAAMLFRQQASEAIVNLPNTVLGDPAESRDAIGPILGAPIPPSMPARVAPVRPIEASSLSGVAAPPPAVPPPELSRSYPKEVPPGWPAPLRWAQPAATREKPVVHKIRDGDTLSALAQRYLGSPARAVEIFDANREVLSNPELLPIGAELKIPPREPQGETQRPLVPVTQRPLPAGR
jgi:nucleoid-associated protein YgaU